MTSGSNLLAFTDRGIYCEAADVYIDPWKPVERAIITHAHGDHARFGTRHYLAHTRTVPVLRQRLGSDIRAQAVAFGEIIEHNDVRFSLHPAGHIPGSAQVRVERGGEVWVVSGDYKIEPDGVSETFEPVRCNTFISECTFGLPIYRWQPQAEIFRGIDDWWRENAASGVASVLLGYSLGKAQRLLGNVNTSIGPVFAHGAVYSTTETLRRVGVDLPPLTYLGSSIPKESLRQALILAPPSVMSSPWLRKLAPYSIGFASGWMLVRGTKRRRGVDRGFALSDHVDWPALLSAVKETHCDRLILTHGFTEVAAKYFLEHGLDAKAAETEFGDEKAEEEVTESAPPNGPTSEEALP